jgi:hypothetical protein
MAARLCCTTSDTTFFSSSNAVVDIVSVTEVRPQRSTRDFRASPGLAFYLSRPEANAARTKASQDHFR